MGKRATWHPMSKPPRRAERVLVYCPSYCPCSIRPIAVEFLRWCNDATHWHPYQSPYPTPPIDKAP